MCCVLPFTMPCCRRTYVAITRTPSCPSDWPKSKCPADLCIQAGYEPEERNSGACWRCRAQMLGASAEDRETMRPAIDTAGVVVGLEELGPAERRHFVERNGVCWFCASKPGCTTCKVVKLDDEDDDENTGYKRSRLDIDREDKQRATKRLKIEGRITRSRAKMTASSSLAPPGGAHAQHLSPSTTKAPPSGAFKPTQDFNPHQIKFSTHIHAPHANGPDDVDHNMSLYNNLDPALFGMNPKSASATKSATSEFSNYGNCPQSAVYTTQDGQQQSAQSTRPQARETTSKLCEQFLTYGRTTVTS